MAIEVNQRLRADRAAGVQALCDQVLGKEINVVGVVDISTDADYFSYQIK
jgi:hypothetical protein